jgi:hypothetical protein
MAPGHNVWAVYGRTGQGTKALSPEEFRRQLAALGQPLAENPVGRYIVLWQFKGTSDPPVPM